MIRSNLPASRKIASLTRDDRWLVSLPGDQLAWFGADARGRGVPPEQRSCGRTLAEDLQWVRGALARIQAAPAG